uniref:Uncharacterized protein n=1 Tax=Arundo donax TaxID=35708 RepID=A0A0A9AF39_ARUDO
MRVHEGFEPMISTTCGLKITFKSDLLSFYFLSCGSVVLHIPI